MKKVFIPINTKIPVERQFPNRVPIWGNYEFIISTKEPEQEYDYVVVLDDIEYSLRLMCCKQNICLFTGEPPYVKLYPRKYLNQFGHVYTCQSSVLKRDNACLSYPALPWMLYYNFYNDKQKEELLIDYDFLKNRPTLQRKNKICLFTSNKKISKGHIERIKFALKLQEEMPDLIDIYGSGFTNVDYKYEVMVQYKYAIVIENCSYPYYWTEKLADTFLSGCYPIYFGDPHIGDFFSRSEMAVIDIRNFDESKQTIKKIIDNNVYEKQYENICHARDKILDKYNMFSLISSTLDSIPAKLDKEKLLLSPMRLSVFDRIRNRIYRLFY